MTGFAAVPDVIRAARQVLRPPPELTLSEWADEKFRLSAESAAEPGRWSTLPYQREPMDCITNPAVVQVTMKKSARVGFTLMVSAAIGYHIEQDPCSILVVQPTVDDAKEYSKETVAPMLSDVPALSAITVRNLEKKGPRSSSNTLTHKAFPGGILSIIGANSGSGFRRKSRRVVIFDEVDAYPQSAGPDGDPIKLGIKRTEYFWNRKIVAGSTPLVAQASRIDEMYEAGDRRRYFVPCPHCGHMAPLVFRGAEGHSMRWDEGLPETAYFVCQGGGCVIEHKDKRSMVERGEWRADRPFKGHASFHIWAAYSYSPNATWGHIAQEFVEANAGGPEKLRTFVNTTLGETWVEKGEAPEWERLYERRERYERGTVPAGVVLLTAGVDVQRDRLVWEVVGWGDDRQSWSIDADVIMGDTAGDEPWARLGELLDHQWPDATGRQWSISVMAVDSGDQTQRVYDWVSTKPRARVLAVKGVGSARVILDAPKSVDLDFRGKRRRGGVRLWPVGSAVAKSELYGWLGLKPPTREGDPYPAGYCHHPEYGEQYFKQLTAEQLVKRIGRGGRTILVWEVLPGRENHWLDCRVYARAAAMRAGLDRLAARKRIRPAASAASTPAGAGTLPESVAVAPVPSAEKPLPPAPAAPSPVARPRRVGWLGRDPGGWLGRR